MYEIQTQNSAVKYGVPVPWIQAVIEVESNWVATAHSANDGYGLMQLLLTTAQGLGYTGTAQGLFDPTTNIDLGTKFLAQLRGFYGDDFQRVYSHYNSGKPDAYLTNPIVADHVAKAVAALTKYINLAVTTVTGNPGASLIVIIIAGYLLMQWVRKNR